MTKEEKGGFGAAPWRAWVSTSTAAFRRERRREASFSDCGRNLLPPHDLRRTFAGEMLDAGVDLVTVQKPMGHASPVTTSRYDRRDEKAKLEAATKIHIHSWGIESASYPVTVPLTQFPSNDPPCSVNVRQNGSIWEEGQLSLG